jgi:dihydroorotate dehydrogenase electron transfer subunit
MPLSESEPRPDPVAHRAEVVEHRGLGDRYRLLRLHAQAVSATALPGQFVMLTVARDGEAEPVLPRPMAVYRTDLHAETFDVLYGVVGSGTRRLATFSKGEQILTVGPLGRGFDLGARVRSVLLLGRGIGTCSLTTVASVARDRGIAVTAVASGRHLGAVIGAEHYRDCEVRSLHEVTDAEGSSDLGHVWQVVTRELDHDPPDLILTCGSHRLLTLSERLAGRWSSTQVQVSVEAHMACGLGYCHGCASGAPGVFAESPLICRDGPVFGWWPA